MEVVHTWHYGINDGDGPAEIIVFYAGEKDTPITVKAPFLHNPCILVYSPVERRIAK